MGLFDNALAYENESRVLRANNKFALEQARQQDMMARLLMQQGLITNRMQQGPGMMNAKRLQTGATAKNAADKALVDYVMSLNPAKVEPQWRYSLARIQDAIKANPASASAVAKIWTSKYRPAGLQFKTMQTMGTDADGNPIPMTSLIAVDPMTASVGPVGGGMTGTGSPSPKAARSVTTKTPGVDALEAKLRATYFGGTP